MVKYANGHYFDEESKRMFYMLGVFYSRYIPGKSSDKEVVIRCRNEELMDLVKRELEISHKTIHDSRGKNSHWIEIRDRHLRSTLEQRGLVPSKWERRFPENMSTEYKPHFVRGFLESQARIKKYKSDRYTAMTFLFNRLFLKGLNETLIEHAGIERKNPDGRLVTYGYKDSIKIYFFIYKDWDFIEENKLYLNSQKDKFNVSYKPDYTNCKKKVNAFERSEKIKYLLEEGKTCDEIAKILGFASRFCVYSNIKKQKSSSVKEFKKKKVSNLANA